MFAFDQPVPFPEKSVDLLAFGEILVDMIAEESDQSDQSDQSDPMAYQAYFGGSPSNLSMNCSRFGLSVSLVSALGNDRLGHFLLEQIKLRGLDNAGIQRLERPTSMVLLNRSSGTPIPAFYRNADYHLEYTPYLAEQVKQAKLIHFSCWPVSRRPARDTLLTALDEAKRQNALICFDPNHHPGLWEDGEEAIPYLQDILSRVDIVKPSQDDAERIFGSGSPHAQMQRFHDAGANLVILTLGKDGLMASNGTEILELPSVARRVVDTTGAGDAFWSGLYAALLKGYSLRRALEVGSAVSAFKLEYCGAVTPFPALTEIETQYLFDGKEVSV